MLQSSFMRVDMPSPPETPLGALTSLPHAMQVHVPTSLRGAIPTQPSHVHGSASKALGDEQEEQAHSKP